MNKPAAWIMNVDKTLFASVSQMEIVHIINRPELINIPKAPAHCCNVIIWNEILLPVIDLACLAELSEYNAERNVVAVTTYRNIEDKIHYGGIILEQSPSLEFVENSQICDFPDTSVDIQNVSLSCFESQEGHKVPILDLSRVFSRESSLRFTSTSN